MTKMKKLDSSTCWQGSDATETLMRFWRKRNWYEHFGKLPGFSN